MNTTTPKTEAQTNVEKMLTAIESLCSSISWLEQAQAASIARDLDPSPLTTAHLRKFLSPLSTRRKMN